jgi:hypothetical protein
VYFGDLEWRSVGTLGMATDGVFTYENDTGPDGANHDKKGVFVMRGLPDQPVLAYAFNNQVPGPRIRVTEGDRVRINVTNHLPESTTVHWHGLVVPNDMDGAAHITQ